MRPATIWIHTLLVLCAVLLTVAPADAQLRFGGGVHYLRALGDIKDAPDFDENALGFMGSVDFRVPLLRIEGDVEFIPDYYNSSELMIQPQAYGLLGSLLYGGVGLGIGHLGNFGWQKPFFALRAGVDFMLGGLDLDVFASYRFQKADDLKTINEDSLNAITFAALIRFGS